MASKNNDNEENNSFKVKDRRSVSMSDDEVKEGKKESSKFSEQEKKEFEEAGKDNDIPEITFSMHVMTLYQQGCFYLGIKMPHPDAPEPQVNLQVADINIKTLDMLKEKTANNMTPDEEKLISEAIYDLKMKYIAKAKEESPI